MTPISDPKPAPILAGILTLILGAGPMLTLGLLILLASCSTPPSPSPEPRTIVQQVKVPIPVPCKAPVPERPIFPDETDALLAAPTPEDRLKLVVLARKPRIKYADSLEETIRACKQEPDVDQELFQ